VVSVVDDDEDVVRDVGQLALGNAQMSERVPHVRELVVVKPGELLL
jgi:hypothetical protein